MPILNLYKKPAGFQPLPNDEGGRTFPLERAIQPDDHVIFNFSQLGSRTDFPGNPIIVPAVDLINNDRVTLLLERTKDFPQLLASYEEGSSSINVWTENWHGMNNPWALHSINSFVSPGVNPGAWEADRTYGLGDTAAYEDSLWYYTGHRFGQDQDSEAGVEPNRPGSGWQRLTPAPPDIDFFLADHLTPGEVIDVALVGTDIYALQEGGTSITHIDADGGVSFIQLTLNPGAGARALAATDKWFFCVINPNAATQSQRTDGLYLAVFDHEGNHQQYPASAFGFNSFSNRDGEDVIVKALITSAAPGTADQKVFWNAPSVGTLDAASDIDVGSSHTLDRFFYTSNTRDVELANAGVGIGNLSNVARIKNTGPDQGRTLYIGLEDANGNPVLYELDPAWETSASAGVMTWRLPNTAAGDALDTALLAIAEDDKIVLIIGRRSNINSAGDPSSTTYPQLASSKGRVDLPHGLFRAADIDEENDYEDSVIHLLMRHPTDASEFVVRVFFNEDSGAFEPVPAGTQSGGGNTVANISYAGPLLLLNSGTAVAAENPSGMSVHDGILRLYQPDGHYLAFDATYDDVDPDEAGHDPRDPEHDGLVHLGGVVSAAVNDEREVFTTNGGQDVFIYHPVGSAIKVDESTNLSGDGSDDNPVKNDAPLQPGYAIAQSFKGTFSNKGDRYVNGQYDGSDGHTSSVMTELYFGTNQLGAFTNRDVRYGDHRWRLDNNPGVAIYSSHGKLWLRIAFTPLTNSAPAPYAIRIGGETYRFADATAEVNVYNWEVTQWEGVAVTLDDLASVGWAIEVLIEPADYINHVDNEIARIAGRQLIYRHANWAIDSINEAPASRSQAQIYPDDDAAGDNFNTRRNLEDAASGTRPASGAGRKFVFNPNPIFSNTDFRLHFQDGDRGSVDAHRGEFADATPTAIADLLPNTVFKFPIDCYVKLSAYMDFYNLRSAIADETSGAFRVMHVNTAGQNDDNVIFYGEANFLATHSTAQENQIIIDINEIVFKADAEELYYITFGFNDLGGLQTEEIEWQGLRWEIGFTLLN